MYLTALLLLALSVSWTEAANQPLTIDMKIDHTPGATVTTTYKHKYIYNGDSYKKGGPLLFYAGGPENIDQAAARDAFVTHIAAQLNAAIAYGEHRYYGNSWPYNTEADSLNTWANAQYLTVPNILADYVDLINDARTNQMKDANAPVIAIGGINGGLYADWLLKVDKTPVTGVYASSAPLEYFPGTTVDVGDFDNSIAQIFVNAGCNFAAVQSAYNAATSGNIIIKNINDIFSIEPAITATNLGYLKTFIKRAFYQLAKYNLPYKVDFDGISLPANAVAEACKNLTADTANLEDKARNLASAIGVYYTVKPYCVDPTQVCAKTFYAEVKPPLATALEQCTQLVPWSCSQGANNDFFDSNSCTATDYVNKAKTDCSSQLGNALTYKSFSGYVDTVFNATYVQAKFGFDYSAVNKAIYTTGTLDGHQGGIYATGSPANSIYVYKADGSIARNDLLAPKKCDPENVKSVRFQVINILKCWTNQTTGDQCDAAKLQYALTANKTPAPTDCAADVFPYGQSTGNGTGPGTPADPKGGGSATLSISLLGFVSSILIAVALK